MKRLSIFDLTGKAAVITGGGGGIGRGIAQGLAEAGCDVVVCGRKYGPCAKACEEIAGLGVRAHPVRCDVSRSGDVENLVGEAIEKMGAIDILVNNAGIEGKEKPFLDTSEEDWDSVMDINLKGAFLCSRAAAGKMIERGKGGRIINISSIAAFLAMPNVSAYSASKSGLLQLTRTMALELAEYDIQVNVICPGYFETPMSRRMYPPEIWEKMARRYVPMKRRGRPEELKGAAIYLASAASGFMTGSCIVVDGGQHIW